MYVQEASHKKAGMFIRCVNTQPGNHASIFFRVSSHSLTALRAIQMMELHTGSPHLSRSTPLPIIPIIAAFVSDVPISVPIKVSFHSIVLPIPAHSLNKSLPPKAFHSPRREAPPIHHNTFGQQSKLPCLCSPLLLHNLQSALARRLFLLANLFRHDVVLILVNGVCRNAAPHAG